MCCDQKLRDLATEMQCVEGNPVKKGHENSWKIQNRPCNFIKSTFGRKHWNCVAVTSVGAPPLLHSFIAMCHVMINDLLKPHLSL